MKHITKIIIGIIVVGILTYSVLAYNDKISVDSPRLYRQAIEFYQKGDYQNAYYNFSKIKKISPLYKMAVLREAQSAEKLLNYETAILKYNIFLKKYPKSVFASTAKYSLAKCYFYSKDYDNAQKVFLTLFEKESDNDYSIASNYFLGLISEIQGNNDAKNYFLTYLNHTTNSSFSLACADKLKKYASELRSEENLLVGKTYFDNAKYNMALQYLYKVPVESSWAYLAIANNSVSNKPAAKKIIETGIQKYSTSIDPDTLHLVYEVYAKIISDNKIKGYSELLKLIRQYGALGEDYVMYVLANASIDDDAVKLYGDIVQRYSKGNYAPESLWKLFWNEYKNQRYTNAKKIGIEHLNRYPNAKSNVKMLYWMAKLSLKESKSTDANNFFNKILTKYPDTYYAFRTNEIINKKGKNWATDSSFMLNEKPQNIDFPFEYSNINIKDIKLITTLLELGDTEIWTVADLNNKIVESWFEYKRGHISRSAVLARNAIEKMDVKPDFLNVVYKLAYPMQFQSDINKYSKITNLDAYLMLSLIREESYFDASAESLVGAVGLTQLMPSTAKYIAEIINMPDISTPQTLQNPEISIILGCEYLRFLKNTFNGNDLLAISAYNGGDASIKRWLNNSSFDDPDEFVESIPYPETQDYVKKVFRSYWNYLNIYKK